MGKGRRVSDSVRVMALSGCFALVAGAITSRALWHLGSLAPGTHVPWWIMAVACATTEVFAIHLDVRRDTFTVSLVELPIVVGFFVAAPLGVIVGRMVGSGLALVLHRRQRPIKLVFNLSLFWLETCVALWVFRLNVGHLTSVSPPAWAAALVAALAAAGISAGGVATVIKLYGGAFGDWRRVLPETVIPPIASTSLGLGAAALLWSQSDAAWLLLAIAAVQFLVFRAYATLSQRYANLQRLYEFTGAVQQSPKDRSAVTSVLGATRSLLRAEIAELAVLGGGTGCATVSTAERAGVLTESVVPVEKLGPLWGRALRDGVSVLAPASSRKSEVREQLSGTGRKDLLVVPLRHGDRIIGAMSVADREGDVGTFDAADLRLFETVVNHAAIALELSRMVERLEHESLHDALTGLPNRTLFNRQVDRAISSRSDDCKVAVLLIDLDRFKEINDTLGHHHGDLLLCEVGARLSARLATVGTLARLGGDEFAVVLDGLPDAASAIEAATEVRNLLEQPFPLDDLKISIGASVGVALSPDHGDDPVTLLQRADVAMYSAKDGAGVEAYDSGRDHYSPRRLRLMAELRRAIETARLELHYQPKADLETGAIVGVEALLRWPHEEFGFIPPDEFIPIAEHTGLIRPLTEYVVRRAVAQCRAWRDRGFDLHMSINVSVRNLVDAELADTVRAALAQHQVDPSWLILELTESSIMSDPDRALAILQELAAMGLGISVDDFGTGYSSLTYLKRLPVTELKIDKSFVQTMDNNTEDAAIVRSIVDLGANLGLTVTAEGVETRRAWDTLQRLGCNLAQGYYLSRPQHADQLTQWLTARRSEARQVVTAAL